MIWIRDEAVVCPSSMEDERRELLLGIRDRIENSH